MGTHLSKLNKDEIASVCRNINYDVLLRPVKRDRKSYAKYTKILGNMDKNSPVVKAFLPKTVADLCTKGNDKVYIDILEDAIEKFKEEFEVTLEERLHSKINVGDLSGYDIRKLARLYIEIYRLSSIDFSSDFYFAMLKVNDVNIQDEAAVRNEISVLLEEDSFITKRIQEATEETQKRLDEEREKYAREKKEWAREKKELSQSIKRVLDEKKECEKLINDQKSKLIEEWKKEFEAWRKSEIDEDEKRRKAQESELQNDLNKRVKECEEEIELKQKEFLLKTEEEKSRQEEEQKNLLEEYQRKITELEEELENFEHRVSELVVQESELTSSIATLKTIETDFFDHLEERVLSRKIESIVLSRFSEEREKAGTITQISAEDKSHGISIMPRVFINSETAAKAEDMEDFLMDYRDNISIMFDNASDIARSVIAALCCNKAIIVEEGCAIELANDLSALLSESSAYVIDLSSGINNMTQILNNINDTQYPVLLVRGLLDAFDELTFSSICNNCANKYLFFEIGDINKVEMMSKAIDKHAIVFDISAYLHTKTGDNIIVGKHDVKSLINDVSTSAIRDYFDKLVLEGIVAKKFDRYMIAVFAEILAYYVMLSNGNGKIGSVLSEALAFRIDNEDEEKEFVTVLANLA